MDATLLRHLAAIAARFGADLRVAPWRALLLGRVETAHAARIADAIGDACITNPADPRLLITACIGRPGCASASVATRADAARIHAARLHPKQPTHVSGCSKGCAHPGPSPLTLVGANGLYSLIRNGRAADPPAATNLTLEAAIALA
jgi:precorrin-3B synthase